MPTLPLSILNILGGVQAQPPGGAVANEGESFQALLEIGGSSYRDGRRAPPQEERRYSNDTPAAPLDLPVRGDRNLRPDARDQRPEHNVPPRARKNALIADRQKAGAIKDVKRDHRTDGQSFPAADAKPVTPDAGANAGKTDTDTVTGIETIDAKAAAETIITNAADAATPNAPVVTPQVVFAAPADSEAAALPLATPVDTETSGAIKDFLATKIDPVSTAPDPLLDRVLGNIERFLLRVTHVYFSENDGPALAQALPSLGDDQALLTQLKGHLKQAFALLQQYETGEADADAVLQNLKPLIVEIRDILTKINANPILQQAIQTDAKGNPVPVPVEPLANAPLPLKGEARAVAETLSNASVPAANTVAAPSVSQHIAATALATIAAAAEHSGSDAGRNSGGQSNGNPSLAQSVPGARASGQPGTIASANMPSFARTLEHASQRPAVDQVVFHIRNSRADGSSRISIQLEPADLGKLDIKLKVDADGKTGVQITADNKNTLDMLQRDARGLERALADAGLKTDSGSLSFNLRGEQHEQEQHPSFAGQRYQNTMPEEVDDMSVVTRSYVVDLSEGLDIRI